MTRPPDDRPTTVLAQQTVEQPAVSTAPATRRSPLWHHVPARIGRARTSTVTIGCLFVLLFALNTALPRDEGPTTTVTTSDGRQVEIPRSLVPGEPATTPAPPAPVTTPPPPAPTSTATQTSQAPRTTATTTGGGTDRDEQTTAPGTSTQQTPREPPRTSSAPTSRAPSTSAQPTSSAPTS